LKLRTLAALLLPVLFLAGDTHPSDWRRLADEARFEGGLAVVELPDPRTFNGYYDWFQDMIVLMAGPEVPDELMLYVLYHEIGHAQQRDEGVFPYMTQVEREWDADRRAVEMLCKKGMNPQIIVHLFAWARRHFAYTGDSVHGLPHHRTNYALTHAACPMRIESP